MNLRQRVIRRSVVMTLVVAAALFGSAGRLDWPRAWAFLGLLAITGLANFPIFLRLNPALARQRLSRPKNVRPFDKFFIAFYFSMFLLIMILPALAVGRMGRPELPWAAFWAGVLLHVLGNVPILWALVTNPHAEATVRIQQDRGHQVISTGPYRLVRHPMYVGIALMYLGWPLALGSLWAYLPAGGIVLVLVLRTAWEDRILHAELPGYAEYARSTRYRLLPGVW
jgi:protein-S-isoprenylcysteine O-methyltransferase Ste14